MSQNYCFLQLGKYFCPIEPHLDLIDTFKVVYCYKELLG